MQSQQSFVKIREEISHPYLGCSFSVGNGMSNQDVVCYESLGGKSGWILRISGKYPKTKQYMEVHGIRVSVCSDVSCMPC